MLTYPFQKICPIPSYYINQDGTRDDFIEDEINIIDKNGSLILFSQNHLYCHYNNETHLLPLPFDDEDDDNVSSENMMTLSNGKLYYINHRNYYVVDLKRREIIHQEELPYNFYFITNPIINDRVIIFSGSALYWKHKEEKSELHILQNNVATGNNFNGDTRVLMIEEEYYLLRNRVINSHLKMEVHLYNIDILSMTLNLKWRDCTIDTIGMYFDCHKNSNYAVIRNRNPFTIYHILPEGLRLIEGIDSRHMLGGWVYDVNENKRLNLLTDKTQILLTCPDLPMVESTTENNYLIYLGDLYYIHEDNIYDLIKLRVFNRYG